MFDHQLLVYGSWIWLQMLLGFGSNTCSTLHSIISSEECNVDDDKTWFYKGFWQGCSNDDVVFLWTFQIADPWVGLDLYAENQISKSSLYCFKVWEP